MSAMTRFSPSWARRVAELAELDPQFRPPSTRVTASSHSWRSAQFLRHWATTSAPPARLHAVEDRLALLERLKRKYGPRSPTSSAGTRP
jgi:DNA repair ATPase RecN